MSDGDPIFQLVASVFEVPVTELSDRSSPDTIRGWDSLGHLRLVTALEDALAVELDADDIMELESVGDVRRVYERYAGAAS